MSLLREEDCFNINVHGGTRNQKHYSSTPLWSRVRPAEWEESLWFSPEFYSPATTLLFLSCLLMRFPVKLKPCFSCPILWNSRPLLRFPNIESSVSAMSIFRHPMPALRDLNQKSSVAECAAHGIRCVTGCNVKVPLRKVSVFAMFPGSCFSHKKTSHLLEWGKNDIPIITCWSHNKNIFSTNNQTRHQL